MSCASLRSVLAIRWTAAEQSWCGRNTEHRSRVHEGRSRQTTTGRRRSRAARVSWTNMATYMFKPYTASIPYHTGPLCHDQCWGLLRWPNAHALPEWEGRVGVYPGVGGVLLLPLLLAMRVCSVCKGERREIDGLVPIILQARPVRLLSLSHPLLTVPKPVSSLIPMH